MKGEKFTADNPTPKPGTRTDRDGNPIRKIDIDKLSDHDLQDILLMHNLTPRKYLRFKTSA